MTLTGIECLWKVFFEVCDNLMRTNFKAKFIGNKAKRRISKWVCFQENKARQIFLKTKISYPSPPTPPNYGLVPMKRLFWEKSISRVDTLRTSKWYALHPVVDSLLRCRSYTAKWAQWQKDACISIKKSFDSRLRNDCFLS